QQSAKPNEIAVYTKQGNFSYSDIYRISNYVAHMLHENGVAQGEIVVIFMEKNWKQVPAIIGTMMAGAVYLPVSPSTPEKRIQKIFETSAIRLLLCDELGSVAVTLQQAYNCLSFDETVRSHSRFNS